MKTKQTLLLETNFSIDFCGKIKKVHHSQEFLFCCCRVVIFFLRPILEPRMELMNEMKRKRNHCREKINKEMKLCLVRSAHEARLEQDVFRLLGLLQGCDINNTDGYGENVLIATIANPNLDPRWKQQLVAEILKNDEIDLHQASFLNGTALTASIYHGETEIGLRLLDEELKRKSRFHEECHPGALHCVVLNNDLLVLKRMIELGADSNRPGSFGYQRPPDSVWRPEPEGFYPFYPAFLSKLDMTPLSYAIQEQRDQCVRLFSDSVSVTKPNQQ